jgi:DNA-binding transcriptional MerR regulator
MAKGLKRDLPVYTISVASRLTSLPVYTIRWLEAHQLLRPKRTSGRQRLFSDADIEFLTEVADFLAHGVNLAGIRAILYMKREYSIERLSIEWSEEEP